MTSEVDMYCKLNNIFN